MRLIELQLVIIGNERSMSYCKFGSQCRDSKCQFEHPWQNAGMRNNVYPPHFYQPMAMNMCWGMPAPPGCMPGYPPHPVYPFHPGFPPPMHPYHMPFPSECYMNYYQHPQNIGAHSYPQQPEPEVKPVGSVPTEPNGEEEESPRNSKPKKRKHKVLKEKKRKEIEDPVNQLAEKMQNLTVYEPNIEEGNGKMKEYGFTDQSINKALLKHLNGDVEMAMRIMWEVEDDHSQEDIKDFVEVHKKYLIIKSLDFNYAFKRHKILTIMAKCKNDLGATLDKLRKKQQIILKKNKHVEKVAALKNKYQEKIEQQIPEGCEFLIDGFNIVYTNKHLRKLFYSNNLKNKVEAIIRLRILVESLAEGHLVLDKKFLTDQEEKEIEVSIGVVIKRPPKTKVVYADEDSIADDKIVQILTQMQPQRRKNILLVTGDHELIQRCLHVTEGKLMLMNGKRFIKQAKKLHDKGVRKSILMRRH